MPSYEIINTPDQHVLGSAPVKGLKEQTEQVKKMQQPKEDVKKTETVAEVPVASCHWKAQIHCHDEYEVPLWQC
eukprot:Nk52_evm6s365 gene=Nk52_evmTU6s365